MSDGGFNMLFSFHTQSAKYIQIYEYFVNLIRTSQLKEHEKLPSIRMMAEQLNVSRNTILEAYDVLLAEGYICSTPRKGYYVNSFESIYLQDTIELEQKLLQTPMIDIDFRVGAVDKQHFPHALWQRYSKQVLLASDSYTYGEPFGEPILKQQLKNYLFQARGIQTSEHSIVIGSSTQQLLLHLSFLLNQNFDTILLEDPGYDGARKVFELQGFQIEEIAATDQGLQFESLYEKTASLFYVTPSHQYPFGTSLPIQQRLKLIEWACQKNGYLIEDDYDGEFRYSQKPFPALTSLNPTCTIYLGTFSKSFLPGIRLAYMVLPPHLIENYQTMFQHFENSASKLHQITMAKFIETGEWTKHIRRMRKIYREKMTVVKEALVKYIPQGTVYGDQAGLYLLIKMPKMMKNLTQKARQNRIHIQNAASLFHEKNGENFFLLGFANCTLTEIKEGIRRLADAWEVHE